MRDPLVTLINATLTKQPIRESFTEEEWRRCFDMALVPRTPKSKSSNFRRIYIAKRMLKNNWKFKEYSNMSAGRLVLKDTIVHFKTITNDNDNKKICGFYVNTVFF